MTDIPAKIPRPIGSTEIFFPGIWKAAWALVDAEAEALSAAVTPDDPLLVVEAVTVGSVVGGSDGEVVELVDVDGGGEEEEAGVGEMETEVKTIAGDTEDDAEVVVVVLWVEDVVVVVDVEVLEVVVEEVEVTSTITHSRTTCTKGSPLGPVTGENVILHSWVTGPAEVSIVCTVCITTGSVKELPAACRR